MSLCVSVFSRERHNVQMLRASLSETSGIFDLDEGVTGKPLKFADDTKLFIKTKEL